jgi:hypothetical protein
MSGFGKDLRKKEYTGKVFHKCSIESAYNLLNNFNYDRSFSCSTPESHNLAGGSVCFVFNVNGCYEYDNKDTDAGKNFGYDEIRITFDDQKSLIDSIETIIINDSDYRLVNHIEGEIEDDPLSDEEWEKVEEMSFLEDYLGQITNTEKSKLSKEFLNF